MDEWTRVSWPLETRFSTYLLPKFPTRGWGWWGGVGVRAYRFRNCCFVIERCMEILMVCNIVKYCDKYITIIHGSGDG